MTNQEIVEKLQKASDAYYNSGNSFILMTDAEFDTLVDQLKQQDPTNEFLKRVGAPAIGTVMKHRIPMGSQEKIKDQAEFDRWIKPIQEAHKEGPLAVVQLKLDGSSIAIYYKNGKLTHALSRGDGIVGEVLTENVIRMSNVKTEIPGFTGSLRGEIMLTKSNFGKYFKPLGHKNPRNTAAGLARNQKADAAALQPHLFVYYYDIENGIELTTEADRINKIASLGLIPVTTILCETPEDIWAAYHQIEQQRPSMDVEIDGIIVRANSIATQKALGESSDMRPKGQRAIKFQNQTATTYLRSIEWTIGHTGAIVPTGKFDPVNIGGATISSVLLNNVKYLTDLKLTIGAKVEIERSGDIIPHIKEVLELTNEIIEIPQKCLHCQSTLIADGVNLVCQNEECDGVAIRKVKTWITKREIKFIGDELLGQLYEHHNVKEPQDLYKLTYEYLSKVPRGNGIVGTGAKVIIEELEKSKKCNVAEFLGSVCIKFMGRRQAEIIYDVSDKKIRTLDDFFGLTKEYLLTLPGFKESKAEAIIAGLALARPTVDALLASGVHPEPLPAASEVQAPVVGGKLNGAAFCFTGAILKTDAAGKRFTRQMMWSVVSENGGVVHEEVSKTTNYLVQADKDSVSSKTKKAVKYEVKILSEQEFWGMIDQK